MSDTSSPLPEKIPTSFRKMLLRITFLILLLLRAMPALAILLHNQFVPSPEWINQMALPGQILGVLCGLFFFWALYRDIYLTSGAVEKEVATKTDLKSAGHKPLEPGSFKAMAILCSAPFFGYFLGSSAVYLGFPMAHAYILGSEAEINFQVTDASKSYDSNCPNRIEVADLPSLFDKICGFPEDFQQSLKTKDWVAVQGKGSLWGVFPASAHLIE